MNQILVTEKVYVTPKLKRKKMFYKIVFILSVLVVLSLIIFVVYSEYDKRKGEAISKQILDNIANTDTTVINDDTLVVALNDGVEEVQPKQLEKFNTVYKTDSGKEYKVDSVLNIPSLEIRYPVLSESSDDLLKISLNKFWGGDPNSVGNYCIVGHNYDGKDIFFGKLNKI